MSISLPSSKRIWSPVLSHMPIYSAEETAHSCPIVWRKQLVANTVRRKELQLVAADTVQLVVDTVRRKELVTDTVQLAADTVRRKELVTDTVQLAADTVRRKELVTDTVRRKQLVADTVQPVADKGNSWCTVSNS